MSQVPQPIIGVTACFRDFNDLPSHIVGERYVLAVREGAGGLPLVIPALGSALSVADLIARLDGLFVTGSPTNIEPRHYAGEPSRAGTLHDPQRDATTLPLIRAALAASVPVFAVCRGLQELNVALGGTLHQHLEEVAGHNDHRSDKTLPAAARYRLAHRVRAVAGGLIARLAGDAEFTVNSLHGQGIAQLAPRLAVEALAPDGVIEAVRVENTPAFAMAVQWHPEWLLPDDPVSAGLFAAFGNACRERALSR